MSLSEALEKACKKFDSCAYSSCSSDGLSARCSLNGYPVLDCPRCQSYKSRGSTEEENDQVRN